MRLAAGPAARRAAAAGALALTLAGCATNPATGGLQLSLIGEGQEIQMGREAAAQVEATIGLYQDQALQSYVSRIGHDLAAGSERPNLPWSFQVVEEPVVNAFALPGGFIYVARGILANFNSEAELAAVLGHEIGHVTARHSVEQISRAQLAQLGLGVGSIFVPEIAAASDVLGLGLGLLFLKYGRDDERQSDELGLRYMSRAGYDQREMVDVFEMLSRLGEGRESDVPGWLSTHPDPGDRRERTAEILAQSGAAGGIVRREEYLRMVDGLAYGVNPRNGYFRGSLFLHPELEFRMEFPDGWRTQNLSQAVVAGSPNEDAIVQLTLAKEASPEAAARSFFASGQVQGGIESRAPVNGLPAVSGEFEARTQSGTLVGLATFIRHGSHTFQLLAYTVAARARTYGGAFRDALGSFRRLTDPRALAVQPKRVRLVELDRPMTLEAFARRYPSTISLDELALMNGVRPGDTLEAGRLYKRVEGEGAPSD